MQLTGIGVRMDIESFKRDVAQFGLGISHGVLEEIDLKFHEIEKYARDTVDKAMQGLRKDWPASPLLIDCCMLQALGSTDKEVPLTRALAWLLTPRTKFRQAMLAAVLDVLLRRKGTDADTVKTWTIKAEAPIRNGRVKGRIDILAEGEIDGQDYWIAVEAKIKAAEGRDQIERYSNAGPETDSRVNKLVVFLTPDGRRPESAGAHDKEVIPLCYRDLLVALLPVLYDFDKNKKEAGRLGSEIEFGRLLFADIANLCGISVSTKSARGSMFDLLYVLNTLPNIGGE